MAQFAEKNIVSLRRQDLSSSMGRFPLYQSNFHWQKDAQRYTTKKSAWKILDPSCELNDEWHESKKAQVTYSLHVCSTSVHYAHVEKRLILL